MFACNVRITLLGVALGALDEGGGRLVGLDARRVAVDDAVNTGVVADLEGVRSF